MARLIGLVVTVDDDLAVQAVGVPDVRGQVHERHRPGGVEGDGAAQTGRGQLVQRDMQGCAAAPGTPGSVVLRVTVSPSRVIRQVQAQQGRDRLGEVVHQHRDHGLQVGARVLERIGQDIKLMRQIAGKIHKGDTPGAPKMRPNCHARN